MSNAIMSGPVVRPGILEIAPYVGGESKAVGAARLIRLASNEGALGPSPKAIAAYHAAASEIHRYPDGHSIKLRETIARHFGLERDQIVCGTGSDEIIILLARAYAGPGDEVVYSRHGFLMYPLAAQSVGARPVVAPERNLTTDVDALLAAVTPLTRLVFIANPNNPTGTFLPPADVRRLHAGLPPNVVLVLDSAYAEYVTESDYEPGIELVREFPNVVMLRTFSKIYALGSLRVGWAYCPPGIADVMNRLRGAFNLSTAAQAAAVAALEDIDFVTRSRDHNAQWRAWTTEALTALDLKVTPSAANFVLIGFPDGPPQAEAAWDDLKAQGILTRKMTSYGLPGHLRVTIGTGEEMAIVVDAFARFLDSR